MEQTESKDIKAKKEAQWHHCREELEKSGMRAKEQDPELPNVFCAYNIRLPMTDGTGLATDIYFPSEIGPFPVILARSTYGKPSAEAERWMLRGYVLVIQDVRGLGDSEGEFVAFEPDGWGPDHTDGNDTIKWIMSQPWCSGKVGTYGGSALGITQVRLAPGSKTLSAQTISAAASDFYGNLAYQGGVWRKELCEGWLALFGEKGKKTKEIWKAHPQKDEYWERYDVESRAYEITAPGIHFGGWWDIFAQGTINSFLTRQNKGGEGARGNQVLIMKNCPHGEFPQPDYTYRENRDELRVSHHEFAFFDHWLKGEEKSDLLTKRVKYYIIGDDSDMQAPGNEWREADSWPPFEIDEVPFFLSADKKLCSDKEDAVEGFLTFEADPHNPCPTLGGQNLTIAAGPWDQRRVSSGQIDFVKNYNHLERPSGWDELLRLYEQDDILVPRTDILEFETEELTTPLEIAGQVRVALCVSTNVPDTDFTAKLVDIYPDGREILLLDSIVRLKYRVGFERAAPPMQKGEVVPIEIDLWHTSCIFNTGHKIGLRISGSNYPRFEINPNTGEDFPSDLPMMVAKNTVQMGKNFESALILPLRASGGITAGKTDTAFLPKTSKR